MLDYTIGECFTLPSRGKVYRVPVSADVKLRSMTTLEEMKRLAPSEKAYKNMCEIIDDCMVEDIGISSYDMHIGDYEFLLHRLRAVTYGEEFDLTSTCPYCGCANKGVIELNQLPLLEYSEDLDKVREFDLPKSKAHIKLRYQTPRLLDIATEKAKEYKKKASNLVGDPTILFTVEGLVEEKDGARLDPLKSTEWVRNLPMIDTNTIIAHAQKMNDSIGVNTKLEVTCDTCGLQYHSSFRPGTTFFRPRIDI